jgi:dTDP-4-amino-4,6-dideoxygalactose transaminase
MTRLYLSPPDVGDAERELLLEAFDSGWIAPLGPHVDRFEREFSELLGVPVTALASGTAALHLALLLLGVQPGDDVVVPSLTFIATANAVAYVGARPVFLDSESETWNVDPGLLAEELDERARRGVLPAAVVVVDLYGQCASWDPILDVCRRYEVPVVEDAAEALGATYDGRPAGTLGEIGVFSFNGNKIITTSGGGMLAAADEAVVGRARHLATQARDPAPHYEHHEVGHNYRLSNLLGAVGLGQLRRLPAILERRQAINRHYRAALADEPGIAFMPTGPRGTPNHWLTVVTVDEKLCGASPARIREHLETADIEARPAWKPMHLQPLFADAPMRGGRVAEEIFRTGLCLPSGTAMSEADVTRVVNVMRGLEAPRVPASHATS